jgi:alkylation response protein AidB-like acyl-CoA dehydrogenase
MVAEEATAVQQEKSSFDALLSELRDAIEEDLEPNLHDIDVNGVYPETFMRRVGSLGGFRQGTSAALGGAGRGISYTIRVMEEVSKTCLSTGFCVWCQTVCAWYIQNSENEYLKGHVLPKVISGETRGGTGLSNPIKHLSGIERIKLGAERRPGEAGYVLDGAIPWISNVDDTGHYFAVVAGDEEEDDYTMAIVLSDAQGVKMRNGGHFIALEGSSTWGWRFKDAFIPDEFVLAAPAQAFIKRIRPGFVLTQTGIGLGLVGSCIELMKRANNRADIKKSGVNDFLDDGVEDLEADLNAARRKTYALADEIGCDGEGLREDIFEDAVEARIVASELSLRASRAAMLHMGASGYLMHGTAERKLRESYFVAIVTPALKHLRKMLHDMRQAS